MLLVVFRVNGSNIAIVGFQETFPLNVWLLVQSAEACKFDVVVVVVVVVVATEPRDV